jgi:hypothetical protein
MWRFILTTISLYLLIKLVFDIIIPVFKTTRQVRRQFQDMKQHVEQEQVKNDFMQGKPPSAPKARKADDGDYLEVEEIK